MTDRTEAERAELVALEEFESVCGKTMAATIRRLSALRRLATPAPVDANASAEARLREALEEIRDGLADTKSHGDQGPRMTLLTKADAYDIASNALSPDPHASDCAAKTIYDVLGDQKAHVDASDCAKQGETTKSEGGVEGHASSRPLRAGQEIRHLQAGIKPGPSDRTADVTVEELADFIYDNGGFCPGDDEEEGLARALLDAFTVGRR